MSVDEFFNKYNGRYIDYDGSYGYQCKDLFSAYNEEVVGNPGYVKGNARNIYHNAPSQYYNKVSSPQKGDVVVWNIGPYGHIAIYNKKNIIGFTSFDQNMPGGSPCHFQWHTFSGIIGYLRPKLNNKEDNFLKKMGFNNYEELKAQLKKDFVSKRIELNQDMRDGSVWWVNRGKRYKIGTKSDDISVLASLMCGEQLSDVERNYPITKNRKDVI